MTTNTQAINARTAGLLAGMEPAAPRKVPAEFSAVADEWLSAYDSMSVSIRSGFGAAPTVADDDTPTMTPPVKRSRRSAAKADAEVST